MSNKPINLHKEKNSEEIIDLKRYLFILYHNKWILLAFIAFFTTLAVIYSLFKAPVYESSFSIYYKQLVNHNDPGQYNNGKSEDPDSEYWLKVMNTQRLLELTQKNAGIKLNTSNIRSIFTVGLEKKNNSLYNIRVKTNNPQDIPTLARSYVTSLNQIERENNSERLSSLLEYLRNQLAENKKKLNNTNRDIAALSNLLNIEQITDRDQLKKIYNSYKKSLKDLKIKLSTIRAEKNESEKEFNHLKDTLFYETSFSEPLKVQLMNLKIDLARALTKYKEAHPHILRIKENIKKVETLLNKGVDQNIEIKNLSANPIKRDLFGRIAKSKIEEQSLLAEIDATQAILTTFNQQMNVNSGEEGIEQKLNQRELLIAAIKMLDKRITETDTFLRGSTNNFITINPAKIPTGKSNKALMFYIIIGLFSGTFMGIGFIILLDLIDNRLKLVSDVEDYYRLNILGTLLHRRKHHDINDITKLDDDTIDNKYYRELTEVRINIEQLKDNDDDNLISIISPYRREGKTTTAFLIAKEYARSGKKVLLVDLDTYIPKLTKALGMEDKKGLQDFLLTDVKLYECIQRSKYKNIDILGGGQNPFNNQIFYDNNKFEDLLAEASRQYDKVILDTPGLLFFPEIVSIVKKVNALIIITRMGRTTRHKLDSLIKKISSLPTRIMGTIITDVHTTPFSSEYSYYHNNYYSDVEKKRYMGVKGVKIKQYVTISAIAIAVTIAGLFAYNKLNGNNKKQTASINLRDKSKSPVNKKDFAIKRLTVEKKAKTIKTSNTNSKTVSNNSKSNSPKIKKAEKKTIKSNTVKPKNAVKNNKVKTGKKQYLLVANVFSSQANADRNCATLKDKGYKNAFVLKDKKNFKVILANYNTAKEALKHLKEYESDIKTWIYKHTKQ